MHLRHITRNLLPKLQQILPHYCEMQRCLSKTVLRANSSVSNHAPKPFVLEVSTGRFRLLLGKGPKVECVSFSPDTRTYIELCTLFGAAWTTAVFTGTPSSKCCDAILNS